LHIYWRDGSITREAIDKRVVAGLGFFDGVHLGHQAILHRVEELATKSGAIPLMITFDRHPLSILSPDTVPKLLTSPTERRVYAWDLGITAVAELVFDENLATMDAERFASDILANRLGVISVVAGEDFSFGHRGQGGVSLLRQEGHQWGIDTVDIVEPLFVKESKVSSTRIRNLLREGKVEEARECLGRPYRLAGPVITGEGRGRALGFPTANLAVPSDRLIPKDGVYAVTVRRAADGSSGDMKHDDHEQKAMIGVLSIGDKPTFAGSGQTIEVHILDKNENYYSQKLEVSLHKWLRPTQRFGSAGELKHQVDQDIKATRQLFTMKHTIMPGEIYTHRAL